MAEPVGKANLISKRDHPSLYQAINKNPDRRHQPVSSITQIVNSERPCSTRDGRHETRPYSREPDPCLMSVLV